MRSLSTLAAKQRLVDRAACLRITVPFVRSHDTAALELGLGILLPPAPMTHVTRPCVGTHHSHRIKHHLAPYRGEDIAEANGFAVLGPARTAVDIARANTACLEQSSDGAEAVSETLMRLMLEEAGLGLVVTQFGMRDEHREAWADARVGRHLFEFDGRRKYERPDSSRRPLTPADVLFEEKIREDWFRGYRLGMTRFTWADVWGPGRAAAKARARREYDATTALWGTDISDLAPYIVRERRRAA